MLCILAVPSGPRLGADKTPQGTRAADALVDRRDASSCIFGYTADVEKGRIGFW
jgi:hypothetical protein